jgi:outer membrane protein OmpA-like peptidoglycan-associated protein
MPSSLLRRLAFVALVGAAAPPAVHAQGFLHKLKDKAKEKVDQHTDDAAQSAVDKADAAVTGTASDAASSSSAQSAQSAQSASSAPPGAGVWLNYDFVPGDKVLFFDDFASDHVGDLPRHEDLSDGNATVVEIKGTKYFHTLTGATFTITLPEVLPQRFTIEVRYHSPAGNGNPLHVTIGNDNQFTFYCYLTNAGLDGAGTNGDKHSSQDAHGIGDNDFVTCRLMVDGSYAKGYINEQRLAQLNGLVFDRTNQIRIDVPSTNDDEGGSLLTDIRVAEGGKPLYDALAANGRVSTHGILFATGSATIEGESTPTLQEIADMLTTHPDLKLLIEGHTDNVGSAAANQALSEQRAAAVKQYLVSKNGIAAARLQTKGYGASKPAASNDTPAGRQQNRRVELVRM